MKDMDMIHGPLLSKMVVYAIPLVFSGVLQLLFNAADIAVVGRFTGPSALAAVSAASPVSSLIVTLFTGLSVGAREAAGNVSDRHPSRHPGSNLRCG